VEWLAPLLATLLAAGLTVGAGIIVARRFRKLGGGEAQERLNATYKELNVALQIKIDGLLVALDERNDAFHDCKKELDELAKVTRRERLLFQQDADDLRTELRGLRNRADAADVRMRAASERQDASDRRQDASAERETG
jgi:hypothetical protein